MFNDFLKKKLIPSNKQDIQLNREAFCWSLTITDGFFYNDLKLVDVIWQGLQNIFFYSLTYPKFIK